MGFRFSYDPLGLFLSAPGNRPCRNMQVQLGSSMKAAVFSRIFPRSSWMAATGMETPIGQTRTPSRAKAYKQFSFNLIHGAQILAYVEISHAGRLMLQTVQSDCLLRDAMHPAGLRTVSRSAGAQVYSSFRKGLPLIESRICLLF